MLGSQLDVGRCPHCNVDRPTLERIHTYETTDYAGANKRFWGVYKCARCGGLVTAASTTGHSGSVTECYPRSTEVDAAIPEKVRGYLQQALNSLHAAAGAVMLAASAVDAMLKAKGYKEGSLYNRIDKAAADHVITKEMAQWAHEVRIDANDQRHADEAAPLPTADEARRCVDFARALGEFMFVLPAQVQKGLTDAKKQGA
ncbi:MAG: DUF4145 domain-containing protein [Candidatus Rokubacteria bacterium]|nr:DUF4145 domain-containing protein [Candidatus Rokubacteria bacterium]